MQKFFLYFFSMRSAVFTLFIFVFLFPFLIQCSSRNGMSAREIAAAVKDKKNLSTFSCEGSDCCSRYRDCERMCNNIFYRSPSEVKRKCHSFHRQVVSDLDTIVKLLKNPRANDLAHIDTREEFRLLLALDYEVWVHMIEYYKIDEAKQALLWLAQDLNVVKELKQLSLPAKNQILYELLTSAGDRTKPGAVEEGLSQKISFNDTFFQHLISSRNNDMLQMTHEMIRDDLCKLEYSGSNHIELCILRVYCRERIGSNDEYIHSESLRREIAKRIKDEELFKYINDEFYRVGSYIYVEPNLNNTVCGYACDDSNRGCE